MGPKMMANLKYIKRHIKYTSSRCASVYTQVMFDQEFLLTLSTISRCSTALSTGIEGLRNDPWSSLNIASPIM